VWVTWGTMKLKIIIVLESTLLLVVFTFGMYSKITVGMTSESLIMVREEAEKQREFAQHARVEAIEAQSEAERQRQLAEECQKFYEECK